MIKDNNLVVVLSIVSFIAILAFNFDLKPKLAKIKQVSAAEKKAHEKFLSEFDGIKNEKSISLSLSNVSPKILSYSRVQDDRAVTSELMAAILRAAEINGVTVTEIQPVAGRSINGVRQLSIKVTTKNTFVQFSEFIAELVNYSLPIVLDDFVLQAEADGKIQIEMLLLGSYIPAIQPVPLPLYSERAPSKITAKKPVRDPFTLINNAVLLTNQDSDSTALLSAISLQTLKWVGYIQQGGNKWSLAMLPNGKTLGIFQGMIVGVEHARVVELSESSIVVEIKGRFIHLSYTI